MSEQPSRASGYHRMLRDQLYDLRALLRESHRLHEMAILTFDTYTESGKEIFAQTAAHLENIKAALGLL